jgi:hypothetical protein
VHRLSTKHIALPHVGAVLEQQSDAALRVGRDGEHER